MVVSGAEQWRKTRLISLMEDVSQSLWSSSQFLHPWKKKNTSFLLPFHVAVISSSARTWSHHAGYILLESLFTVLAQLISCACDLMIVDMSCDLIFFGYVSLFIICSKSLFCTVHAEQFLSFLCFSLVITSSLLQGYEHKNSSEVSSTWAWNWSIKIVPYKFSKLLIDKIPGVFVFFRKGATCISVSCRKIPFICLPACFFGFK